MAFESIFQLLDLNIRALVFELLMTIMCVTTPMMIIMKSEKLRAYSLRLKKDMFENAFIMNIFLTPALLSICINSSLYAIYWCLDV